MFFMDFLYLITYILLYFFFFFFQAEDGIRDRTVTRVQTCALPISRWPPSRAWRAGRRSSSQSKDHLLLVVVFVTDPQHPRMAADHLEAAREIEPPGGGLVAHDVEPEMIELEPLARERDDDVQHEAPDAAPARLGSDVHPPDPRDVALLGGFQTIAADDSYQVRVEGADHDGFVVSRGGEALLHVRK